MYRLDPLNERAVTQPSVDVSAYHSQALTAVPDSRIPGGVEKLVIVRGEML